MKSLFAVLVFLLAPVSSHAEVPTALQLEAQVKSMRVPSLEDRLRARAAAYRIVTATARMMGFGDNSVRQVTRRAYVAKRGEFLMR
ncbi:MAG: hypothetical protein VX589_17875 [Myxococcota bacterium]|nr:hypothetical protein [Myxococcota bacterium]